jgi:hypothetical protein
VVGHPTAAAGRFEGAVNGVPHEAQWQTWRCPVSGAPTASRMLSQCPVWRCSGGDGHTVVDSDGEDHSRRPDVTV